MYTLWEYQGDLKRKENMKIMKKKENEPHW